MAITNGNGDALKIKPWLLGLLLTLLLAAGSGWVTVASQARNSLSREEAYKSFVAKADYAEDQQEVCRRLVRIEDKLDRLAERVK